MEIRIRNTGEVMTEITFRNTFRDRLVPPVLTEEWLNEFAGGCDVVFEGPQATGGDRYQYSVRNGVEQQSDGKWYTKYVLGPTFTDNAEQTAAEQEAAYKARMDAERAAAVRADRARRLAETDWMVIRSAEGVAPVPADVVAQRQALRDITKQPGFPWDITWP